MQQRGSESDGSMRPALRGIWDRSVCVCVYSCRLEETLDRIEGTEAYPTARQLEGRSPFEAFVDLM